MLHRLIENVSLGEPVDAIGIAIGGPLNVATGVVSPLHQPAWRDVPLKAHLEARWPCPCFLDVDTNVAAVGEYIYGADKPDRLLYITLSTGMGGGFMIDGRLYRGAAGAHPEVAHQAIPHRCSFPERIQCECGAPDCLEALVSGNGIRRIYQKPAEALAPEEWNEVAFHLGHGLRNIATMYAPAVIALGGGVAVGGGLPFLARVEHAMQVGLRLVPAPILRLSALGYDTALYGAVALAIHGTDVL